MNRRRRPTQDIRIWKILDRTSRGVPRPFIVRWVVDGKRHSKAFEAKLPAEGFRARLITARDDGERFDSRKGEPESWSPSGADIAFHQWARTWIAEQWPEWAPRTRFTDTYALSRFVPLVADPKAPRPPAEMRRYLRDTLPPLGDGVDLDVSHPCERWLDRWVLTLGELNRDNLADVLRRFAIGARGRPLAPRTLQRQRVPARTMIARALELGKIPEDPWPPAQRGRSRRKANRIETAVDVRRLPSIATSRAIIDWLAAQPDELEHAVMTAVAFYAGLRPSEVGFLRPVGLTLPDEGWGRVWVTEADDGEGNSADPKTGIRRSVPIPPELVRWLREWIAQQNLTDEQLLFTIDPDLKYQEQWRASLARTCKALGLSSVWTPYDFRHVNATMMIRAGVPLAEVARRLGHTVKMLVDTYINAMEGDEDDGNALVDKALAAG